MMRFGTGEEGQTENMEQSSGAKESKGEVR